MASIDAGAYAGQAVPGWNGKAQDDSYDVGHDRGADNDRASQTGPNSMSRKAKDRHGNEVCVGMRVRVVRLDELGLRGCDEEMVADALSMVGETFEVEAIDDQGRPCVWKEFPVPGGDSRHFHSIDLDPDEFEVVAEE